jgi:hypothetical protein
MSFWHNWDRHIHEGEWVEENLSARLGEVATHGFGATHALIPYDGEKPGKPGTFQTLGAVGMTVEFVRQEDLTARLARATAGTILIGAGGARMRAACAQSLVAAGGEVPFLFLPDTFAEALTLPPIGERMPTLTAIDPTQFDTADASYTEGLVRAMQLGLCFDDSLFRLVYSSFNPIVLVRRCRQILHDIVVAERDGSAARGALDFGWVVARAILDGTNGELTVGEALAIGMLAELKVGVRAAICPQDMLTDLDGAVSYYGLPRTLVCTPEEWREMLLAEHASTDKVVLTLPQRRGKWVLYSTAYASILPHG